VQPLLAHAATSKFDLTVIATDTQDDIYLEVEYSTDLFDAARIERMIGHLSTLLAGAVSDPHQNVASLPLLTSAERQQLLGEWNEVQADEVY
jgi:non-ribosomal peptide synthetase component F